MKFIYILILMCGLAKADPIIYRTFEYNDFYTGRKYCSCYASNVDYGTLWEFQVNTNLAGNNWTHWGSDYYTGYGTNYPGVPYVMASWAIDRSPQAFFRMHQIGTNFVFYANFDAFGLMEFDSTAEAQRIEAFKSTISAARSLRLEPHWVYSIEIPDCLYPPGFLH